MKQIDHRRQLMDVTPDVPDTFHQAMCDTLNGIVAGEKAGQTGRKRPGPARRIRRRALALGLIAALLLAGAAFAAYHWQLFDTLSFLTGSAPSTADDVMHSDLAQVTVNGVQITIQEAGYDGKTLLIQYAYQFPDVDTPLGVYRYGETGEGVSEEDLQLLTDHNVGWWIDHLWVNGKCVDMPSNSGGVASGSTTPGELIQTEYWRLDNEDVQLSGTVEISLPIGDRQSSMDYRLSTHPEMYGEDGLLKLPEKGMVTFTLDTDDMLSRVRTEHPDIPATIPYGTVQVSEACYTPLMTYLTLTLSASADAMAAYQDENGVGFYGEDGQLLWAYTDADVFADWICSLNLVDGDGNVLFPDTYGNNGYGGEWTEFVYPYIETMPDALYLAPVEDGTADMTYAVQVK